MKKKKRPQWTPDELEQLSLHELADLLANIVVVLRRMPDVPVSDLVARPAEDATTLVARLRREPANEQAHELPEWVE